MEAAKKSKRGNYYEKVYENADGKTKQCENAVEIVGVTLPDGMTELVIPEMLDGKDVISLAPDFDRNVRPSQDETDAALFTY